MEKLDLKKKYKELYAMKKDEIRRVEVAEQRIISIVGEGDPNKDEFKEAVETLYPIAYKVKFMQKELGRDFVVMPLEAYWWADDMSEFTEGESKDRWKWEVFLVMPEYINKEDIEAAKVEVGKKKELAKLDQLKFRIKEASIAYQLLHIGAYSEEGENIARLHRYIKEAGHNFDGQVNKHHEIYLSDPRRVAEEKLKTIIRQSISE